MAFRNTTLKGLSYLLLFLLSLTNLIQAQSSKDSLLNELRSQPADSQRVKTLNNLFIEEFGNDLQAALKYEEEAFQLAQKIDFQQGIVWGINNMGVGYYLLGNYPEALKYHQRLYDLVEKSNDSTNMSTALNNMGSDNYLMGNYSQASKNYEAAMVLSKALRDTGAVQQALNNLGSCYKEQGNYPEALSNYLQALEIAEGQNSQSGIALTLGNIGMVYLQQNQDSIALYNLTKALAIYQKQKDNVGLIVAMRNFGDAFFDNQDYEQAANYFGQALSLADSIGHSKERPELLWKSAETRLKLGDPTNVLSDYLEAEKEYRNTNSKIGQARMKEKIGQFHLLKQNYPKALQSYQECEKLSQSIDGRSLLLLAYRGIAKSYAGMGNHKVAYEYHQKFHDYHEQIYSDKKSRLIAEMQQKYEAQKKEKQIANFELSLARSQKNSYLLVGGIGLLFLFAIFLIYTLRQKNRSNEAMSLLNREIEAQKTLVEVQNEKIKGINSDLEIKVDERTRDLRLANQELDAFLYESAHALRRPITTTKGLINLMEIETTPEGQKSLREKVEFTLERMDRMLHKLITVNENFRKKIVLRKVKVEPFLQKAIQQFKNEENIAWDLQVEPGLDFNTDLYRLEVIFQNLVENAIAFRRIGETEVKIQIKAIQENNGVKISIRDNGMGIKKKVMEKIFKMFQRGTELSQGNGLGLFVARKFAEKLGGTVVLESEEDVYTEASIWLPNQA